MSQATQLESGGAPGQVRGVPEVPVDSRPSRAMQGVCGTTGRMSLESALTCLSCWRAVGVLLFSSLLCCTCLLGLCEAIASPSTGWWNPQIREMKSREEISFGFAKGQWQRSGPLAGVIIWATEHFSTSPLWERICPGRNSIFGSWRCLDFPL